MFATIRKKLSWNPISSPDKTITDKSLLLAVFMKLLEDVLFWKYTWVSVSFIFSWHIIFFVSVYREINLVQFILCLLMTALFMDAFESWLKHKHRTACLKRIAHPEPTLLITTINRIGLLCAKKWKEFVYVRETNHTKAFLVANLVLGTIFVTAAYMGCYLIIYVVLMLYSIWYKIAPPIYQILTHILQDTESEAELEGLIPEETDINIKLLSIEPEKSVIDAGQSLDYWKPEDIPIEEASDSSENSSSIATNFSMEKVLQKDVDTSDSSEDEYIPLEHHKEQLKSTLEIAEPSNTWGTSAYNAIWSMTSAVSNMMQSETKKDDIRRKRMSSVDSSDGFEMVDENEVK